MRVVKMMLGDNHLRIIKCHVIPGDDARIGLENQAIGAAIDLAR
jgi:hypothetical protein